MPRMPQQPRHECGPVVPPHGPAGSSASENIKLKVLEDRLKAELAPRDMRNLLDEVFKTHDGDLIYIYDTTEEEEKNRLKAIKLDIVRSVIIDQIEDEVHEFALRYELVSELPAVGERNVIYMVPVAHPSPEVNKDGKNKFDEYIWVDNNHKYEKFGAATIDLSAYRKAAAQDIIDNQIKQSVTNEVNRAKAKENEIATNLANEKARAIAAEQALEARVHIIELDYLTSEDYDALVAKITAEKTRATRAEQALNNALAEEKNRAIARENAIAGDLAGEVIRATNRENAIDNRVAAEEDKARLEEGKLNTRANNIATDLAHEAEVARAAESNLADDIAAETRRATGVEGDLWDALSAEAETRGSADTGLSNRITAIESDYLTSSDKTELQNAIGAEETRAREAEAGKADWGTSLADYGITNAYTQSQTNNLLNDKADKADTYTKSEVYTKAETESAIDAKLQSTFRYKGSVQTYGDLPASGNVVGDVWNIEQADPAHGIEAGDNVAWSGSDWDKFGGELAVDSAMSSSSTNPVQNKVIYEALQNSTKSGTAGTGWGPTTVKVGGIDAGTDMSNTSVLDILHDILYPYVAPKSLYVSLTPGVGTYLEKGSSVTVTKVSSSLTLGSKAITSYKLFQAGVEIESGSAVSSLEKTLEGATFTEATLPSFSATATDGQTNLNATASGYVWKYRIYYGVVAGSVVTPTEAQLKTLTSNVEAKSSKTLTFSMSGQKCTFAYPSEYGNLTKIEDSNGFNVTSSFDKQTVSVTNQYDATTTYNVYTLMTPVTSNMTYKFLF